MSGGGEAAGGRRLRVGVLGCGPIAQAAHFDACAKARNAELWAICDLADDLRERMAAVHRPARAYRAYEEMLADPDVEAVIVATADQFHVPLARQAVAAGKHVLVEKPLGVTVEECESLRDEVRAAGLVLQVGHNKRFDPGIAHAARFVREELGEMLALRAWYCDSSYRYTMTDNLQPVPVVSPRARRPEGDPKADRRRYLLLTHGSHLLDTCRYLGGGIRAVRARWLERGGAHCWLVEAELAGGALGHLELTVPVRGDYEEGFRIYGQAGSVIGRVYLPWFHRSSEVECFSARDGLYRRPLGADAHTYKLQLEGFAETIMGRTEQVGASAEDGLATVRAMVAIARSVEGGDWVRLDAVTGGV